MAGAVTLGSAKVTPRYEREPLLWRDAKKDGAMASGRGAQYGTYPQQTDGTDKKTRAAGTTAAAAARANDGCHVLMLLLLEGWVAFMQVRFAPCRPDACAAALRRSGSHLLICSFRACPLSLRNHCPCVTR